MESLCFALHLFDLDDTLLQTRIRYHAAQKYAVSQLFEDLGLPGVTAAYREMKWFSKQIGSIDPPTYMGAFLKNRGLFDERNLALLIQCYRESYWGGMKLYPGAEAYLEQLVSEGKQLGLVSNGVSSTQQKKIHATKLDRFFPESARFISGDYDRLYKKPHPYMLEQALQQFGKLPSEAVYYGNTQNDVLAANLAGVTSLWFGPDQENGDAPPLALPKLRLQSWLDKSPTAN